MNGQNDTTADKSGIDTNEAVILGSGNFDKSKNPDDRTIESPETTFAKVN